MPWKNGGGITTEIFRLPSTTDNHFLFRLSQAVVSSDGPFSIFPNIDRILVVIEGSGFHLTGQDRNVLINKKLLPVSFKGEEAISCALLDGPCTDFNIMTDRNFANSTISILLPSADMDMNFKAECDLQFIYDTAKETLTKLEKNDQCCVGIKKDSPLIVIETKFL